LSSTQKLPRLLCNQQLHYRVLNSQMHTIDVLPFYIFANFPSRSRTKKFLCILLPSHICSTPHGNAQTAAQII